MKSPFILASICSVGILITSTARASIYGDNLTSSGSYGDFAISPGSATAGAGPEFEFTDSNVPEISFDFTPTGLILTSSSIDIGFSVPLSFIDTSHAFTSATLSSTTVGGFDSSDVSFSSGTVTVQVGNNIPFGAGETVDIALTTTAAVPEPTGYGFMVFLAVLMLLGLRRAPQRL